MECLVGIESGNLWFYSNTLPTELLSLNFVSIGIQVVHSLNFFFFLNRFRVGVFDHDVFSFTDVEYPLQTPLVIFTNPVDSRYAIPAKNPIMKAKESTHVRYVFRQHD